MASYSHRPEFVMIFHTGTGTIAAGSTVYVARHISNATEGRMRMVLPCDCLFLGMQVQTQNAAGAGESYVYTLRDNGVPTALTVTIAGAVDATGQNFANPVTILQGQLVTLQLVTSVGAVATYHNITLLVKAL